VLPGGSANLILAGFMGTGKSSVGAELARRLGRPFVDLDRLIEERVGRPVAEFLTREGEPAFRRLESSLCRELAARSGQVIATGGGALLDEVNREILAASGVVVCLTADPQEIAARLETAEDRPLLGSGERGERVDALLAERAGAYEAIPLQVDTTGLSVDEAAGRVLALAGRPAPRQLVVRHPGGEYTVHLGRGILPQAGRLMLESGLAGQAIVVADETTGRLHAPQVLDGLRSAGLKASTCTLPAGEAHKTLDAVRWLYDRFVEAGLDREGAVLALGGGTIGDLAGFAAATYLRGVHLVQMPTTLLAMVDSSVGGKVAVDHPRGKNLIGAFKQPDLVIADLEALDTQPAGHVEGGLAEVVKAGLAGDPLLFEQIEAHGPAPLLWIVERALRVKQAIVEADPFEQGQRAVLNLGHTFGHALELQSGYRLSHGEGVSVGLAAAARLSTRLGLCPAELAGRVERILERLGLPTRYEGAGPDEVWRAMATDKKRRGGRLRFVLLRGVGDPVVTGGVDEQEVLAVLAELLAE